MALIGHSGSCTIGGVSVGTAKIWSVDLTGDTADTTTFADGGWKTNAQTLKGWSGTITVVFDGGADAGEDDLIQNLISGTSAELVLTTDAATGAGTAETYTGDCIITTMPVTNDVNGIIEVAFGFVGTGALTVAALA